MTEGLKPCPFCGEEPLPVRRRDGWLVKCPECDASILVFCESPDDAYKAWNRRAAQGDEAPVKEETKKALELARSLPNFVDCNETEKACRLLAAEILNCVAGDEAQRRDAADAARYRYLRDLDHWSDFAHAGAHLSGSGREVIGHWAYAELDRRIDAAMAGAVAADKGDK